MATGMRNSLTNLLPECCIVAGIVTVSGTTPSVGSLTGGAADKAAVSVSRTSAGIFVVSVAPFGANGNALNAFANGTTTSTMVALTAKSYTASTNTATFTFSVEDDASTLSDTGFTFLLLAY